MPAAHEVLKLASLLLDVLAYFSGSFSLAFTVFSSAAAIVYLRGLKRENLVNDFSPAIAILKPIKGLDRTLYDNLASFCRQDYPNYRLFFALSDKDDPAMPVLEQVRRNFPNIPIDIIVSGNIIGCNPKINNLSGVENRIETEIFTMADSDVRVAPDFIRRCVAPFKDPKVGLVSCFYRIARPMNLWENLEAFAINFQFLPQALTAAGFGMSFAMGAAITVRTKAFMESGGFKNLADHLAEDFILSRSIEKAGYHVRFSSTVIESAPQLESFTEYLRHQERWARTIRSCQPAGYLGTFLLQGFSLLTLKIALTGMTVPSIVLALGIIIAKAGRDASLSLLELTAPQTATTALLSPLGEWLGFFVWFRGWKSTPVIWRGKAYKIGPKGRLLSQ